MRIIIEDGEDWVLQVRAARLAIEHWRQNPDASDTVAFLFDLHERSYGVKRNKHSVRVYGQEKE